MYLLPDLWIVTSTTRRATNEISIPHLLNSMICYLASGGSMGNSYMCQRLLAIAAIEPIQVHSKESDKFNPKNRLDLSECYLGNCSRHALYSLVLIFPTLESNSCNFSPCVVSWKYWQAISRLWIVPRWLLVKYTLRMSYSHWFNKIFLHLLRHKHIRDSHYKQTLCF